MAFIATTRIFCHKKFISQYSIMFERVSRNIPLFILKIKQSIEKTLLYILNK